MHETRAYIVWSGRKILSEIPCSSIEEFVVRMSTMWGSGPWRLRAQHIPMLRQMAATPNDNGDNPYIVLLSALGANGAIEVRIELAFFDADVNLPAACGDGFEHSIGSTRRRTEP